VAQVFGAEPARQHRLRQQDLQESREDEAERELDPDAAHEPGARGQPAQRQGGIAREGDDEGGGNQRQQDPEARIHPAPSLHTRAAVRAAR